MGGTVETVNGGISMDNARVGEIIGDEVKLVGNS